MLVCSVQIISHLDSQSKFQAPVVQRLDNAIQRISVHKTNHAIRWIVVYPVDNVIQPLNNRGQIFTLFFGRNGSTEVAWPSV